MKGVTFDTLMANGWVRLNLPVPYLPFAEGGFPTPSGKCEFVSERMREMGLDPLAGVHAAARVPESVPELAARFPLTLISSPRHQFLNSTFVNVDSLRRGAEPEVLVHPHDAARRGIAAGMRVVVENDRGHFTGIAKVADSVREGVVWAPSIWWMKLSTGSRERQRHHVAARDGHGPRAGVLRQPGGSLAGGLNAGALILIPFSFRNAPWHSSRTP